MVKGLMVEQSGQVHQHIKQNENTFQGSSARAKRQAHLVRSSAMTLSIKHLFVSFLLFWE